MEVSAQIHALASLPPIKGPRYALTSRPLLPVTDDERFEREKCL
jgi:hypothetical protein